MYKAEAILSYGIKLITHEIDYSDGGKGYPVNIVTAPPPKTISNGFYYLLLEAYNDFPQLKYPNIGHTWQDVVDLKQTLNSLGLGFIEFDGGFRSDDKILKDLFLVYTQYTNSSEDNSFIGDYLTDDTENPQAAINSLFTVYNNVTPKGKWVLGVDSVE